MTEKGGAPKTRRRLITLSRVRTGCVAAAVVLIGMMAWSAHRMTAAWYTTSVAGQQWPQRRTWGFELRSGLLLAGFWREGGPPSMVLGPDRPAGIDWAVRPNWETTVSLAWRPYHISDVPGFGNGNRHHLIAIPLWLVTLPVLVAAAYLQGLVVGRRRGDPGRCPSCGYPRRGLDANAPCPECGPDRPTNRK